MRRLIIRIISKFSNSVDEDIQMAVLKAKDLKEKTMQILTLDLDNPTEDLKNFAKAQKLDLNDKELRSEIVKMGYNQIDKLNDFYKKVDQLLKVVNEEKNEQVKEEEEEKKKEEEMDENVEYLQLKQSYKVNGLFLFGLVALLIFLYFVVQEDLLVNGFKHIKIN